MIKEVFITHTNCITPLGFDVASNIENIVGGVSGIQRHENNMMNKPFYAAIIDTEMINKAFAKITQGGDYTRLEKMIILALQPIVEKSNLILDERVGFILSTTKGNVTALANPTVANFEKAQLSQLAKKCSSFFKFKTEPIVVSNACVSGILAVSVAKRVIQSNLYDAVFVVAGDEVSQFVLSGFNSFQAMSDLPCKPYSKNRTGVSLGEATAAALVSSNRENAVIKIVGDGTINDANHISGPSRTGEGLFLSVKSALKEANIVADEIDFISAHGTATPFNDEMEAIALNRLGMEKIPVNSLKGYYGHTLGASGLLEMVIGIESVLYNKLYQSLGFDEIGVTESIAVLDKHTDKECKYFLKTASGFGGCNTAVLFEKVN